MRGARQPRAGRVSWIAGATAAALGAAAAVLAVAAPADAASTVTAQLSLSGIATQSSPTGGSVLGVHPGDTVDFVPATVPTAGLDALGLGGLVGGLLQGVLGYQVVLHLPASFPGGSRDVALGAGASRQSLAVTFPSAGSYAFTWTAYSVCVLACSNTTQIVLDGNQLAKAGIKLNASNQYVGTVVAANDPPAGGIGIQLPGVSVAPSAPGVGQLPTLGVPGTRLTVPVPVPTKGAPAPGSGGGSSGGASAGTGGTPPLNYVPPVGSVPEGVVPQGGDAGGIGPNSDLNVLLNPDGSGTGVTPKPGSATTPPPGRPGAARPAARQSVDLAANRASAGQMPVLLAILAILALSLVTATYARLYLLRRTDPTS